MALRGDRHAECFHPRQVIWTADERVLDTPPAIDDRALRVRLLIRIEHEIDRGVAYRVRGHAPIEPVEIADEREEAFAFERLQAAEGAVLVPRLLVGFAHQATFETAVDAKLDATDAQPRVAFALPDA